MIEYLLAIKLKTLAPNVELSNFSLPQFGIDYPNVRAYATDRIYISENPFHIDLNYIIQLVEASSVNRVESHCYAQRMEYFPALSVCRETFSSFAFKGHFFDEGYLVCPIRGGEVLNLINPDYVQLPIGFYTSIVHESGLRPVFMGQLGENCYTYELRRAFQKAVFLPSEGPDADFQTIRNSKNIIVPVSTFAWLAAWLSEANRIYLPVAGLFNPQQSPGHQLLPLQDPRYIFYQFPIYRASSLNCLMTDLSSLEGKWRRRTKQE